MSMMKIKIGEDKQCILFKSCIFYPKSAADFNSWNSFISFVFIYKKTEGLRIVFQTSAYLVCKSLVKVCVFVQRVNCGILSIDL